MSRISLTRSLIDLRTHTQASGKEKLERARVKTTAAAADAQSTIDSYKTAAKDTYAGAAHTAERTYGDARDAAADAVHKAEDTAEGWGAWLGSWFGYGKAKAVDVKKQGAQKVVDGAQQVEKEAGKHT